MSFDFPQQPDEREVAAKLQLAVAKALGLARPSEALRLHRLAGMPRPLRPLPGRPSSANAQETSSDFRDV